MSTLRADQFVSPTGNNGPVRLLVAREFARRLLKLTALYQDRVRETPALVAASGFTNSIEALCATSQASQRLVLGGPTMAFWDDVACRLFRSGAQPNGDGQALAHLRDLGRFALAACLADRRRFHADLRLDAGGRLHLPGLNVYLDFGSDCPFSFVSCHAAENSLQIARRGETGVAIELESILSSSAPSDSDSREGAHPGFTVRRLPAIGGFLVASNVDPDLRVHGRVSYQFEELVGNVAAQWTQSLNGVWTLIEQVDTKLAEEIRLALRAVVPVKSPGREAHVSATLRELHGAMFCSWTSDINTLAGALVHEFHHLKLNLILDEVSIFEKPRLHQLFYSPWRTDPRPLTGILHGAYSFLGIARFLQKIAQHCPPDARRSHLHDEVWYATKQVDTALSSLHQHASLTSFGRRFLEEMASETALLQRYLGCSNYAPPTDLVKRLTSHRGRWETLHKPWGGQAVAPPQSEDAREPAILGMAATESDTVGTADSLDEVEALLGDLPVEKAADVDRDTIELDWTIDRLGYLKMFDGDRFAALQRVLSSDAIGGDSRLAFLRADLHYVAGAFERAADIYMECLRGRPFWVICWLHLGFSLRQMGYAEASNMILLHTGTCMKLFAESPVRPLRTSDLTNVFTRRSHNHEFHL